LPAAALHCSVREEALHDAVAIDEVTRAVFRDHSLSPQTEHLSRGWWGLGLVAVMPAYQGAGIGGALIRSGLRRLADRGVRGGPVLGDPACYGRFGFAQHPGLVCRGAPAGELVPLALTVRGGMARASRTASVSPAGNADPKQRSGERD
jgi:predicted N-acetyltransferase YhbS